MTRRKPWVKVKDDAVKSILLERDVGYLDVGIGPILETLNSVKNIATTSSCLGRIAIVEGIVHWGRDEDSRIAYKTHGKITPEAILRVLSRGFSNLWLKATGPILHARTNSLECALHMLSKARENGFKHSGIISHGTPSGTVVELMSASQLSTPLVVNGVVVIRMGREYLEALANKANSTVEEGRRRLKSFVDSLLADPGPCG